jgi:hypothetical protein
MLSKTALGTEVARGREHVVDELCRATEQMIAKYAGAGTLRGIGVGVN